MPAYSFEALTAEGETRKGIVDADTAKGARSLLRSQSLVPLAVESVGAGTASSGGASESVMSRQFFAGRVFNATALAIWTRQIAGLVASGLPLERALTALADETDDERQRNLVAGLRAEVNAGTAFAAALAQHPVSSPPRTAPSLARANTAATWGACWSALRTIWSRASS